VTTENGLIWLAIATAADVCFSGHWKEPPSTIEYVSLRP
jgi:hypothetical protein